MDDARDSRNGASGTVGRHIAAKLAAQKMPLRLLTRHPVTVASPDAINTCTGHYGDAESLTSACAGVRTVFAVAIDPMHPDHDENLLNTALANGVQRIVKLSALSVTDPTADVLITRWQRRNEEMIKASSLACTLLRPREGIRSSGVDTGPDPDGRNACIDPRDIAAVAVRVLTQPGYEGKTYGTHRSPSPERWRTSPRAGRRG
ncbi:NAD(P)H-binding protein [Streptomyces sp. NPDC093595]|uniref:NAD(P)H-binding protein n=1 Tax=Streptomyces sp. NPDC093595 TaxID=3366045 RepID=UPI0037FC7F96